jgi:hypothetical protein
LPTKFFRTSRKPVFRACSGKAVSRPNTPVNAVVGSLILKEVFGLSDDELLESVDIDPRFRYALHTTGCGLQPLSDRDYRQRQFKHILTIIL